MKKRPCFKNHLVMSTRVYVGGLSHKAREDDIEYFFRRYGKLREISLKNGFAFIEFDDYRDAEDACYDLHGREFLGERVSVEMARGTPHGRDRERWGSGRGDGRGDRRRERTPGIRLITTQMTLSESKDGGEGRIVEHTRRIIVQNAYRS